MTEYKLVVVGMYLIFILSMRSHFCERYRRRRRWWVFYTIPHQLSIKYFAYKTTQLTAKLIRCSNGYNGTYIANATLYFSSSKLKFGMFMAAPIQIIGANQQLISC